MKKIIKFSAIALAVTAAATVAGCSGCAGCSKTKNTALTNSNWYTGTSYKGIQPSFIADNYPDYIEKINYAVDFAKPAVGNSSYSVDYKDGSFSTEFYATYYDWKGENIPNGYNYDNVDKELVYYYKTEFTISVKYHVNAVNADSEWFSDSIVHECYFRPAGSNLQPVYSKQTLKATSPANVKANSLESAYNKVDVVYENFYNYNCSEVTTVTLSADKDKEVHSFSLGKVKNSIFDNSSLYIAVRSMKLTDSISQDISLYTAAAGGISTYKISGTTTALPKEENKTVSQILADNGLYNPVTVDEEGNAVDDAGIKTVAVNVNYTGGALQGTTQTIWYAAIENQDNNTARTTMLKLSIPLSYSLGTLNFTLKEIQSTLWNG